MRPVLTDERRKGIDVRLLERMRHLLGELAHAPQCEEHSCIAAFVCTCHGGDGVARDARLTGVDDYASLLELFARLTSQRNLADVGAAIRKAERERAPECRRIVILSAAGDAELLDFRCPASLGKLGGIERLTRAPAQRLNEGHASG